MFQCESCSLGREAGRAREPELQKVRKVEQVQARDPLSLEGRCQIRDFGFGKRVARRSVFSSVRKGIPPHLHVFLLIDISRSLHLQASSSDPITPSLEGNSLPCPN